MTRRGYMLATIGAVTAILASGTIKAPTKLAWNTSPSAPIGLYAIDSGTAVALSDLVVLQAPPRLGAFLVERDYIGEGALLLKRLAALPGQTVCRDGRDLTIDGAPAGVALARDRLGRPLPTWQGCKLLAGDQLFFMTMDHPDSLDGRYFGPLPRAVVIGRAVPLWTDEDGDGRFQWRAPARRSRPPFPQSTARNRSPK